MVVVSSQSGSTQSADPTLAPREAVTEFEAILTDEQMRLYRSNNKIPEATDLITFVVAIDANNAKSAGMTGLAVAPRLMTLLEATRKFSSIVGTFVNSNPLIAISVWSCLKTTILVASNTKLFNKVTGMIMTIGKSCPQYHQYGQFYPDCIDLQYALCDYYAKIVQLSAKIIEFSRRPLGMLSFAKSNLFDSGFEFHCDRLSKASRTVNDTLSLFISSLRSSIRYNLSPIDHVTLWKHVLRRKVSRTAEWIFQESLFQKWQSDQDTTALWCLGSMGSGKTLLTSNIVAYLHTEAGRITKPIISYYFCRHDSFDSLLARNILGSLACQIMDSQISQADNESLQCLYEKSCNLETANVIDTLIPWLQDNQVYYLIIDGLDECEVPEIRKVAQGISQLCQIRAKQFKILLTGRPNLERELLRATKPKYKIPINKSKVNLDIEVFIDNCLEMCLEQGKLVLGDAGLIIEIRNSLKQGSDGMFLWTQLCIEELCECNSDREILEALKRDPRDFVAIIDQKLERVQQKEFGKDAMKLLELCGLAVRPFTLIELQRALYTALHRTSLSQVQGLEEIREVIDGCCGLISIEEEDDTVQFIHHSIKQHIFDKFSEKGSLSKREHPYHGNTDFEFSDTESIITSFSFAGSISSKSSLDQPLFLGAVEIFTASLLRNPRFQELCRIALLERKIPRSKVQRNLVKLLRLFASNLGQETQAKNHLETVQFVRGASSRIATRILQSFEFIGSAGTEELMLEQLEEETSRARIEKYFESHGKQAEFFFGQKNGDQSADYNMPPEPEDIGQTASDSDEDSSQDGLDEQEAPDAMAGNGLLRVEDFLFGTNAFLIMEREFFDFVFPSFRSILMRWISKQRRCGNFTIERLQKIEAIVSELQYIRPDQICIKSQEIQSAVNSIKGRWEQFTGETWDWWPLSPYMHPLKSGETRLHWTCMCGKPRWAEVPTSFAETIAGTSGQKLTPSYMPQGKQSHTTPGSQPPKTASPGKLSQGTANQSHIPSPDPAQIPTGSSIPVQSSGRSNQDLHLFLVTAHSSFLRSSYYRLAQTTTRSMSDKSFFSWVRATYYHHRGFFSTFFSVYRYSHCDFFKFEKFSQAAYTPLCPGYPDKQESSYHFFPRPIQPEPPVHPHQFEHWFESYTWSFTIFRRFARVFSTALSLDEPFDDTFVTQRLPKRDSIIEERDPSYEIFWGLYIVEKRSISKLLLGSFVFLAPSVYFFFAWVFQWGHHGDLQTAAIPITVSMGLFATFWLCITFDAPSFEKHRK